MKRSATPSYLSKDQSRAHGPVQWFSFDWSDDYYRLQEAYGHVQASNDPNMLVVFLARHPYHVDSMLQLAMVFARTGTTTRACW